MNQSMQPMILTAATPAQTGRRMRPTRPALGSLRAWFRALQVRGTLGPSVGDHVLGESQWASNGTGFAV